MKQPVFVREFSIYICAVGNNMNYVCKIILSSSPRKTVEHWNPIGKSKWTLLGWMETRPSIIWQNKSTFYKAINHRSPWIRTIHSEFSNIYYFSHYYTVILPAKERVTDILFNIWLMHAYVPRINISKITTAVLN